MVLLQSLAHQITINLINLIAPLGQLFSLLIREFVLHRTKVEQYIIYPS